MSSDFFSRLNQIALTYSPASGLAFPLHHEIENLIKSALLGDEAGLTAFHKLLAKINQKRFSVDGMSSPQEELLFDTVRTMMEAAWIQAQRVAIQPMLDTMPIDFVKFLDWIEALEETGYGQHHPLFTYLENKASVSDFKYFMQQELATEAGFDDLVAMTQVQAPYAVKLELARNYWDEMGNGSLEKMHSVQLSHVSDALHLTWSEDYEGVHWQALALSNLMMAFASHRSYFNQSIGALGAIELTAPARAKQVTLGLKRLGFSNSQYRYYALHSVLDIKHWKGWKDNAVAPLIAENSQRCLGIAEGALMRLLAGQRCYDVYTQTLAINTEQVKNQSFALAA